MSHWDSSPISIFIFNLLTADFESIGCSCPQHTESCNRARQIEALTYARTAILQSLTDLLDILRCPNISAPEADQERHRVNLNGCEDQIGVLKQAPIIFPTNWDTGNVEQVSQSQTLMYPSLSAPALDADVQFQSQGNQSRITLPTALANDLTETSVTPEQSSAFPLEEMQQPHIHEEDGDTEMVMNDDNVHGTFRVDDTEEERSDSDQESDEDSNSSYTSYRRLDVESYTTQGQTRAWSISASHRSSMDENGHHQVDINDDPTFYTNGYPSQDHIRRVVESHRFRRLESGTIDLELIKLARIPRSAEQPPTRRRSSESSLLGSYGYVYALRNISHPKLPVKIGGAANPTSRIKKLQKHDTSVRLERTSSYERGSVSWYVRAEKLAHRLLADRNIDLSAETSRPPVGGKSEYFIIDDETSQRAIDFGMSFVKTAYTENGQLTPYWHRELWKFKDFAPPIETLNERLTRWENWLAIKKKEEEDQKYSALVHVTSWIMIHLKKILKHLTSNQWWEVHFSWHHFICGCFLYYGPPLFLMYAICDKGYVSFGCG